MANEISDAIARIEAEIADLQHVVSILRARFPAEASGGKKVETKPPTNGSGPFAGLTVEAAVDRAISTASRPLTVREIVDRSAAGGKELNINSVRWTLRNGVEAGRYTKTTADKGMKKRYGWSQNG